MAQKHKCLKDRFAERSKMGNSWHLLLCPPSWMGVTDHKQKRHVFLFHVYRWLMMSISTTGDVILSLSFMDIFTEVSVSAINSSSKPGTVNGHQISRTLTRKFRWQLPSPSGFCSCLGLETGAVQTPLWKTMGQRGRCVWVALGAGRTFPGE